MQYSNERSRHGLFASAVLAAALGPPAPAFAQNAPHSAAPATDATAMEASNLEEITVTARRRNERLQDVPIAVTVLTREEIARAGIESVGDFVNLTPNVTFNNALNLGRNFLTIRGVVQSIYGPPPAAIVVDGVLQMSPLQFNVDEFDLQQVEVLKGPQGAIYGRNAIAGAINMTTLKPSSEFQAHGLVSYARGDEWQSKASASGAVIPGLLYVLGGISYTDRRGQVRNLTTGTYSDKLDDVTGRLRVVLTPTENLEADLKYTYSDAKGHDPAYVISRSGNPAISSDPLESNRVGTNPRTLHDLSGKLTWSPSFATATLTLAYVDIEENLTEDLDYTPIDFLAAAQDQHDRGFSQELRFASPEGGNFHWLFGGYHIRSHDDIGVRIFADPFYLGLTPAPTSAATAISSSLDRNRGETWSGFAQAAYDLGARFTVEAAVRFDSDTVSQNAADGTSRRIRFEKWQPKGTLTWKPAADLTVYGSVGQGFRSGTFNASEATFGAAVVRPEVATTYEIGAKTQLFERRLTLNAALYETDLDNGQFYLFDAVAGTNVRINIDKTRIRGLELETALRLADGFGVHASFGYTDPQVRAFTPVPGYGGEARAYIGNEPPRVSKVTANFGFDYQIALGNDLAWFVRPEYRFIGRYYWNLENSYRRPDQELLDIRAGLRDAGDRWALTGFIKNALDEKVTSDYAPFINSGHPSGRDVYYPPVGSIYGVEMTYRF